MQFYAILRKYRRDKGLTQNNISKELGIKRSTYAKYETGENQPDYETLSQLASFFQVTTDELLGRNKEDNVIEFNKNQDTLTQLNNFFEDLGIDSVGFFDIDEWKELDEESIKEIKNHFEWISHKSKQKNE